MMSSAARPWRDVPLQSAYLNGYYDDMVVFLKNMFSAALKTNDAVEKGKLTGCLRIARIYHWRALAFLQD